MPSFAKCIIRAESMCCNGFILKIAKQIRYTACVFRMWSKAIECAMRACAQETTFTRKMQPYLSTVVLSVCHPPSRTWRTSNTDSCAPVSQILGRDWLKMYCGRILYANSFFIRHLTRRTSGICLASRDLDTTTTGRQKYHM